MSQITPMEINGSIPQNLGFLKANKEEFNNQENQHFQWNVGLIYIMWRCPNFIFYSKGVFK